MPSHGVVIRAGYGNVKNMPIACQEDGELKALVAGLAAGDWKGAYTGFVPLMRRWSGLDQAHAAHGVTRTGLTVEDMAWMLENFTGQDIHKGAIEAANDYEWRVAA